MKILAIRLARFGDLVLLLPALSLLKSRLPNSHLTLLTDTRWGPLAEMCPAIDQVITVDRIKMRDGPVWRAIIGMLRLLRDLRRRKFDATLDCHGFRETNLLTWWSGAPERWGLKRFDQSFFGFCFNRPPVVENKSLHASEPFIRIVQGIAPFPTTAEPSPSLVVPSGDLCWAREVLPSKPFVVLYVDAPVKERTWPLDRFVDLANHIMTNLGSPVVVLSGSDPPVNTFPPNVQIFSDLSISRLAAVIASAAMMVSNDTGPMHLGPAFGVPTIGIFSVGIPTHFRPTGVRDCFVQGNPIEKVGVDQVVRAVDQVWSSIDRRDPQC